MGEAAGTERDGTASRASTGRYLYCLVETDGESDPTGIDATGIANEPVSVVVADDAAVGAVVHVRGEPYDSTDLTDLRDWLLAHQRVVEAAGDRYGTPLPVRFDTVLEGGDDAVTEWLARNAGAIGDAFDSIAGCWEYRVTLSWDPTGFEAEQRTADAELASIDRRLDQCDPGKRFLLQKQYDQRLRDLKRRRRETLEERLVDRLSEESARITERPARSEMAASLDVELESDAIAQVAVLAPQEDESALGTALEEITEPRGVDVRFTGPWPPYTFAPTITEE